MRKLIILSALMSAFGLSMAQAVKTYSVYDTNQSNSIEVDDVTTVVEQVKNDVTATSTQQYVTAEDLRNLLQVINTKLEKLSKLEAIETRLAAIELKVGIETPEDSEEEMTVKTFTVNGVNFKMVPVVCGTFVMGTDDERGGEQRNEQPAHQVSITNDYYIGETEVTEELWNAVMNTTSTDPESLTHAKNYVSWEDCQQFISALNSLTGQNFRMPTEAEWEYAARGGNKSKGYEFSGSNNESDVCWYGVAMGIDNGFGPHSVATKLPNELGIYDMCGNVSEMCEDWYGEYKDSVQIDPHGPSFGEAHVLRGGNWFSVVEDIRVTSRSHTDPYCPPRDADGLRLALSKAKKESPDSFNGHDYVDLGITDADGKTIYWATCNVGAATPEEYGDYFAWGETITKTYYDESNYFDISESDGSYQKYNNQNGMSQLDITDDAARVIWGGNWRMPTLSDLEELVRECTWTWTTQNEVQGYLVKSNKNNNSIFLPAAGSYTESVDFIGTDLYYWSSTLYSDSDWEANCLYDNMGGYCNSPEQIVSKNIRYYGRSIRPVCKQ